MTFDRTQRRLIRRIVRNAPAREDYLAQRAELAQLIADRAEAGHVVLVTGGRDCDGVEVNGCKATLPAVPTAIRRAIDSMYEWADGPRWFEIMSPSAAAAVEYSWRDLGAEAFENGHPHVLRP